jgi:hypothetical protein
VPVRPRSPRERLGDPHPQFLRSDPVLADDLQRVELAHAIEDLLSRSEIEHGHRGAGEVVGVAEAHDPDDRERSRLADEEDLDVLPDRQPVLLRGSGVHGHLVALLRRAPLPDRERGGVRVPGHAERGSAHRPDGVAGRRVDWAYRSRRRRPRDAVDPRTNV